MRPKQLHQQARIAFDVCHVEVSSGSILCHSTERQLTFQEFLECFDRFCGGSKEILNDVDIAVLVFAFALLLRRRTVSQQAHPGQYDSRLDLRLTVLYITTATLSFGALMILRRMRASAHLRVSSSLLLDGRPIQFSFVRCVVSGTAVSGASGDTIVSVDSIK